MEKGKQMRFSSAELELVKGLFGGESGLSALKILRKVFLPEYDPNAPLGQAFDLWMTMDISQMHPDQAFTHVLARNQVIAHIEQQLIQLEILAGMTSLTPEQVTSRNKKDSTK